MKVYTEQELVDAIRRGESYIEIEGSLATGVIAIRAAGAKLWLVITAMLVAALAIAIATRKPTITMPLASILGVSSSTLALKLSWLAGGVGILNNLRRYRTANQSKSRLTLKR